MATILAQDSFNRTVSAGSWGTPNIGGPYTLLYGDEAFSVSSNRGRMSIQAGQSREVRFGSVSSTSIIVRANVASTTAFAGGVQGFTIIGRQTATGLYAARIRIEDGLFRLYTMRDEVALTGSTTISGAYTPGSLIWCELSVTGISPTTIAAKMWLDGTSEPSLYQQTSTDSTAGLQEAGFIGLNGTLSGTASAAELSFGSYTATDSTLTVLDTPVVTLNQTSPTSIGGNDGTITATWPAISGATRYETCLMSGTVTSGFIADDTNATSPKNYTGLSAGIYTVAVRAKAGT